MPSEAAWAPVWAEPGPGPAPPPPAAAAAFLASSTSVMGSSVNR